MVFHEAGLGGNLHVCNLPSYCYVDHQEMEILHSEWVRVTNQDF